MDLVRNLEIKVRERKSLDTDNEVAAIVVHDPNIKGLNVKAIYALRTGTNEIAAKITSSASRCLCMQERPTISRSSSLRGSRG